MKWVDDRPIDTTIRPGECFQFIVGNDECSDERIFDLPFKTNYVVAYVKGRTDAGRGAPREFIVGIGEKGFGGLNAETFSVEMINQALASDDEEVRKTINLWAGSTAIIEDIKAGKLLSSDMMSGDAYEGDAVELAAADGVKFLHVSELYLHGFHAADLAAQEPALSWLAAVTAKKEDATINLVVGGADRGFVSSEYPVAGDEETEASLFSLAALVADVADSGATDKWQTFQLKADLGDETSCVLEDTSALIDEAQAAVLSTQDGLGEALAACKADLSVLAEIDASEYEVTLEGYRLGWKQLNGRLK